MELTVSSFMKSCLDSYEALRGKVPKTVGATFWDAVVLSAADEDQASAFCVQISQRKKGNLIPLVQYHVFSDPPGQKIDSGGATLHVLEQLHKIYGDERLSQMRILLMHAGGQSKRLPSHSVLGKLFALLPIAAHTQIQMFDLKMAMYSPFLRKMKAGVFLTCSDDIETYTLPTSEGTAQASSWCFDKPGFTALAHPSPIAVGLTHGVYVLPKDVHCTSVCRTTECLEVLQKPTEKIMREKGAIFENIEGGSQTELAYTDSAFFFDYSVINKLLSFYNSVKPLTYEIDAYRDFLQLLGQRSKSHAMQASADEAGDQLKVQDILRDFKLHVVVLPSSQFYHLGTMQEYIHNLCFSESFAEELQTTRFVHSRLVPCELSKPSSIFGVVMNSLVHPESTVPHSVVLEYCKFEVPVKVGENCILSNCRLEKPIDSLVEVPSNAIIFTVSVHTPTCKGYAAVAFGVNDDLKQTLRDERKLLYFGKELGQLEHTSLIGPDQSISTPTTAEKSLWEAKLFAVRPTMTEAFLSTLELVHIMVSQGTLQAPKKTNSMEVSMEDVLKWKDISELLRHQNTIFS
ncbi:fucose-1-phosphate guanylyltransferase-like isoform X2 [Amblyomma americanum]